MSDKESPSLELVLTYKRKTPLSKQFWNGKDMARWYYEQDQKPRKKKKKTKENAPQDVSKE